MIKAIIASLVFVASSGLAYSAARLVRNRDTSTRQAIAQAKVVPPAPLTPTPGGSPGSSTNRIPTAASNPAVATIALPTMGALEEETMAAMGTPRGVALMRLKGTVTSAVAKRFGESRQKCGMSVDVADPSIVRVHLAIRARPDGWAVGDIDEVVVEKGAPLADAVISCLVGVLRDPPLKSSAKQRGWPASEEVSGDAYVHYHADAAGSTCSL
jgi:hypothetical protein